MEMATFADRVTENGGPEVMDHNWSKDGSALLENVRQNSIFKYSFSEWNCYTRPTT